MSNLPEPRSVQLLAEDSILALKDLWPRCFALGTMNTATQLAGFLRGDLQPTRHEHNLVAVALNEWLSDIGVAQIVPYVEDDAYLGAPWSGSDLVADHESIVRGLPPVAHLDT